jgi:hypothetical protein
MTTESAFGYWAKRDRYLVLKPASASPLFAMPRLDLTWAIYRRRVRPCFGLEGRDGPYTREGNETGKRQPELTGAALLLSRSNLLRQPQPSASFHLGGPGLGAKTGPGRLSAFTAELFDLGSGELLHPLAAERGSGRILALLFGGHADRVYRSRQSRATV